MSESKVFLQSFPYGLIVEIGDVVGVCKAPIYEGGKLTSRPFAYVMIVEPDDAARNEILRTVRAPNCAVDVARNEDEAVAKALQHRPQLIIVKQRDPLYLDNLHPHYSSIASRICRRARLSRAVRLLTHSDSTITMKMGAEMISDSNQSLIVRLVYKSQLWRKEWYSYCARDLASEFLSNNIPFWLGRTHTPQYPKISPCKPFVRNSRITLN
jgi:CheY-like chemotaxis protein